MGPWWEEGERGGRGVTLSSCWAPLEPFPCAFVWFVWIYDSSGGFLGQYPEHCFFWLVASISTTLFVCWPVLDHIVHICVLFFLLFGAHILPIAFVCVFIPAAAMYSATSTDTKSTRLTVSVPAALGLYLMHFSGSFAIFWIGGFAAGPLLTKTKSSSVSGTSSAASSAAEP